ncbi:MAG TPA: calcium-binding protein, partial [Agitococcus sp.]|nr:calcium-binding protein [Agitococcus sp.]
MAVINGNADNNYMVGTVGDDLLIGGESDDNLAGDGGADTLIGGLGDDTLTGGEGVDVYIFNKGDGNDTIYNFQQTQADDKLILGNGFSAANLVLMREGFDLLITFGNSPNDSLRIGSHYDGGGRSQLKLIEFNDGTTLDISVDNKTNLVYSTGTYFAENMNGYDGADIIDAQEASDSIDANGGNDTVDGGAGDDQLWGGEGDDMLMGGEG